MNPKRWQHIDEDLFAERPQPRLCDQPGCLEAGEFKAPKSRDELRDYYFFCLDHVQAYNKSWNFYSGMNEDQIEASRRADITWQRKTWPFTAGGKADETTTRKNAPNAKSRTYTFDDLSDPFNLFEGVGSASKSETYSERTNHIHRRRLSAEVNEALDLFQLDLPLDEEKTRARYKQLAKAFHPDAHGGDKDKEEMFKRLNSAYEELKKAMPYINDF